MLSMKIEGTREFERKIGDKAKKMARETSRPVVVGYTQSYAIHVHENKEMHHTVGKAKYLEDPAKKHRKKIGNIIVFFYKRTGNLLLAMIQGGLFLQRESQQEVPVDTGALKNSAFTRPE